MTPSRLRPLSPFGFLVAAALIAACYGAAHLAGLRDDTSVLSGTAPSGSAARGLLYVALHFAFVLAAPILALAALLLAAVERLVSRR